MLYVCNYIIFATEAQEQLTDRGRQHSTKEAEWLRAPLQLHEVVINYLYTY